MIVAETLKGYAPSAFQMIFSRDSEAAAAASDTDLSSAESAGAPQTSCTRIRQGSSSDEMSPGRKGVRAARLTEGAFPGQKNTLQGSAVTVCIISKERSCRAGASPIPFSERENLYVTALVTLSVLRCAGTTHRIFYASH